MEKIKYLHICPYTKKGEQFLKVKYANGKTNTYNDNSVIKLKNNYKGVKIYKAQKQPEIIIYFICADTIASIKFTGGKIQFIHAKKSPHYLNCYEYNISSNRCLFTPISYNCARDTINICYTTATDKHVNGTCTVKTVNSTSPLIDHIYFNIPKETAPNYKNINVFVDGKHSKTVGFEGLGGIKSLTKIANIVVVTTLNENEYGSKSHDIELYQK